MAGVSKAILVGNLTRDPEMRTLANGQTMTRIGLAVNRAWKDKSGEKREEVSFFSLSAFGKSGEVLAQYTRKGSRIYVEGRLETRTVTNDRGETRTFTDVIVIEFQLLDRKKDGEPRPAADDRADGAADDFHADADDEIPF